MAQLVKNPHAMQETWVWSLGWEDALEKGKATPSSILAWGYPWYIQSMVYMLGFINVTVTVISIKVFTCMLNTAFPEGRVPLYELR